MTPPAYSGAKGSVRLYWLKTPPVPSVARYTVSRMNGSRGPGRQLARHQAPSIVLVAV